MLRFITIIVFLASNLLVAQSFGQNKVQYRNFDWSFITSPHFDIYYYGDAIDLAQYTAEKGEEAYEQISKHLRWTLRKRVPIIIYHSHNDFQQTNVVLPYMQEGIGGVTELFKNRVVIPFEGDYDQFRHVIHHELVHALINDMIYGSAQNVASGRVRLRVPLWANEGLAEFLSMNWDTQSDMILRDLAVHEDMPTVQQLTSFLAYKGGQSVWRFIAQKYGREKIGEIFTSMKLTQNAEKGFDKAIGMDFESLTKQWHKYLKKEYWPDIDGRDEIEDISIRLTDHKKKKNYYNIAPAISPDGSKIAILEDKSGFANITLIDAIDGKNIKRLVKGNRSIDFEELKWLQPGISWSPNNEKIVIAAKAGSKDALYLINANKPNKKEKLTFDLDGIFSASWSPDGNQLAFVGNKVSSSDIYLYDIDNRTLKNLTNDIYSDSEPTWSADGSKIAYVSSRVKQDDSLIKENKSLADIATFQTDIYSIDISNNSLNRITYSDANENYPLWANTDDILFYTSDENGIYNLFRHNMDNGSIEPLTNLLTGLFQISLSMDDEVMAFAGYSDNGWDIFRLSNPLQMKPVDLLPTQFSKNKGQDYGTLVDFRRNKSRGTNINRTSGKDFSNYIFAPEYGNYNNNSERIDFDSTQFEVSDSLITPDGDYIPQPYKTRLTMDLVFGYASYNSFFGAQGMTQFAFSDVLGDHQISLGTELVISLDKSDYYFTYGYLKNRADFYFSLFHQADATSDYYGNLYRLRFYGFQGLMSYPINRFNRIDAGLSYNKIDYRLFQQDYYSYGYYESGREAADVMMYTASYIFDNTVYGYTGPIDGFRQNTTISISPGAGQSKLKYQTIKLDFRKYFMFSRYTSLASRVTYGKSFGPNPQKFILGGLQNWIWGSGETFGEQDESRFRSQPIDTSNASMLIDVYLSDFMFPMRGYRFWERTGSNTLLMNFEFRFPFLFAFGIPNKFVFSNFGSYLFFDIGAAWDDRQEFNSIKVLRNKYGDNRLPDNASPIIAGAGIGVKIPLGPFLFRVDTAWDVNPNRRYSKPQYYVSIGTDW
tara:strand:- start:707 stop:3853 length:3147 start_codon:yes stop_codon:yes gene_type:complete